MKEKTGGELIRPNATRFGTVFVFLQSCWDRKDKFKEWMVLEEWANNEWVVEADYDYTYDNLTSRSWWGQLKWVLDACKPLLYVLQYADPQKNATLSGFLQRISHARQELESHFGNASEEEKLVLEKINKRIVTLLDIGFMHAAGALDPETHYKHSNFATHHAYTKALTLAIQKMARKNQEEVAAAIGQFLLFRNKRNMFGSRAAVIGASTLPAGDWWEAYGGDYLELQKFAKRIVSQCMSSSGCERNWSTFALVHTKVRIHLGYDKIHKLVFVRYNLKLRLQQFEMEMIQREKEADPFGVMMDVALFDEENPIMEWLSSARSESDPVLDQEEIREGIDRIEQDHPSPTNLVIDDVIIDMSGHRFLAEPISACEKRKRSKDGKRAKKKKGKSLHIDEEDVASGDGTDSDSHGTRSPEYAKSGDSSSASEDIHDDYNDNSAAKNGTSNYAPAQNTEGAEGRPIWRAKRRVKNINTLVKGAAVKPKASSSSKDILFKMTKCY